MMDSNKAALEGRGFKPHFLVKKGTKDISTATNIVLIFTKRIVILMQHRPCPPFPPTGLPRAHRRAER